MNALKNAGEALDRQRPAEAFAILTEALAIADGENAALTETLLLLRNYCAWLMGDWTDMPTIIGSFRRARELQVARALAAPDAETMWAAVASEPGRLELAQVPVPEPLPGFVKIRVRAFGLNRSEKLLHEGGWPVTALSPVSPLINGIECAGEVVANGPPTGDEAPLALGTRVLACARSLGRGIDGSHAEFVVVPRWAVVIVPADADGLSWRELGALPLSYGTAAGSLDAMDCSEGDTILVRGGTSALGLATISLAGTMNCTVVATSRRSSSEPLLRTTGADVVLIEPNIRDQVRELYPDGVDCALECIGESTLKETMHCVRRKGVMCQTGALSHPPDFRLRLLGEVPSSVKVTCFESDVLTGSTVSSTIDRIVDALSKGTLRVPLDPTEFTLEHYGEALVFLDSKERQGKVVVTVA